MPKQLELPTGQPWTLEKLARYLTPRTISLILQDCRESIADKEARAQFGYTVPENLRLTVKILERYMAEKWVGYKLQELPDDPWFTIQGRFGV